VVKDAIVVTVLTPGAAPAPEGDAERLHSRARIARRSTTSQSGAGTPARQRLLDSAYELFSRRGVRDVGIDEILARSGVAKATLYRHFPSKDDLVLEFLALREQRWTIALVEAQLTARADTAEGRLLAVFDVFDEWFRTGADFDGCSFVNVLLEMGPDHPLGRASAGYLANIRAILERLATEAGLREPSEFAHSCHILMKGCIVAAAEGDLGSARRAQAMARSLIESHR
jgi:AcrR family transcriptional regulator